MKQLIIKAMTPTTLTPEEHADECMVLYFNRKQPKTDHGKKVLAEITYTGIPHMSIPNKTNSTLSIAER